ncbi:hypothetical protein CNECB9_5380005 [Cupriavidus necator]|uniref:Uncharacterized protein n=1 Tax=Cupriavidus necator TaxID=106590 RepID=A0A1K0IPT7_CUPNE|nr:hypothetical protein CNECB9_5380005 [Cupriavidus necator]
MVVFAGRRSGRHRERPGHEIRCVEYGMVPGFPVRPPSGTGLPGPGWEWERQSPAHRARRPYGNL